MNKNIIFNGFMGLVFSIGLFAMNSSPSFADTSSPIHNAQNCFSEVELPQNKEELDLDDVQHALQSYLLRIGASGHKVSVSWFNDDIIAAEILHNGELLRRLKVDVINAKIIQRFDFQRPVGFETPRIGNLSQPESFRTENVKYSKQLRRHMLGDGHSWGTWINSNQGISCLDDYRYGGPELENIGS